MQHLVSKVEEMKQQRLMLAGQLRDLVCNDDITRQVLTYSGDDIQVLFERELKKYDKYVSLVEQNLAAQENILRALKETYARYGSTRKNTGELHRKRGAIISSLIASYDAYEDLLSKSSKGLDFYKKLETNVSKLLQRVKGTCKVQDEEREQMLKTVKKSDVGPAQSDAASSNTLKLKDYLNIKKETGKLSLEPTSTVPNSTPYFNDTTLPQQNWIPSVRPAPVGSEETDTSFNVPLDSFRGFYQSQGKDQIWSNSHYSAPQSADQKLKFFLPHANSSYSNNSQNSSFPLQEDAYPISSYSTLAPKVEGQGGYEPKSNYYDVHGSPNRCYNLPNSYNNSVGSTSTSSYKIPKVGLNQVSESNDFGQNASDISSYNDYANQITSTYTASQQLHGNFSPLPEALSFGSSQSFENQSRMLTTYNPSTFSQPHLSFTSTETDQNLYSSGTCPPPQIQTSTLYNSFSTIQTPTVYGTSNDNQPTQCLDASAYSSMYQAPLATSIPSESTTNFTPQKQIKDFPNSQSYQIPVTTFAPDTQMTYHNSHIPQSSCPYGSASTNSYVDYSSVEGIPTQYPRGTDGTLAPWLDPNLHLSDQQYLQSGNESLYTASQIPNQYAMTNSDVYKTSEPQNLNYQNYHGQYYSNQYGAYSSPADFNAHSGNVTYMQAGTDKQQAITTTTFSNSETKSSPVTNPSNVDLLAGLDFNISHSPLVPEVTASLKKEDQNEDKSNALKVLSKPPPETTLKLDLDKECVKEESSSLKDCMSNKENIAHFAQEVEKYEKFVEGLTLKTLNGPTSLDLKWKEIVDAQVILVILFYWRLLF